MALSLSGSLPYSLGALTALEALYLCNNSLYGNIPPEIAALTQLREVCAPLHPLRPSLFTLSPSARVECSPTIFCKVRCLTRSSA